MASSDREVEEQLLEAGNKIADPPTSVEELLPLLDRIESLLARVEQSPSKSMQSALTPSLKALVSDQLLRHSDADVKVAVAACISEITRITAPDAPYNDEQMKEVFHLIVSSFENLSDKSSRSYGKRASILETVAKVRSCVVMLDLECDGLITEMFQYFLKTIRDYHPENVFSSMETIMSLVLEESEDISVELLSPVLTSVKKDNGEILPIARKLGERVLNNCSTKLKPYLIQAVKNLGISLDDYSDVVASICKEHPDSVEPNHIPDDGENVVDEEKPTEMASSQRVDPAIEKNHDIGKSNGIAQDGDGDVGAFADSKNKKEEEHGSKEVKSLKNPESANLDTEKSGSEKKKPVKTSKKRGRKPNLSVKSTKPSETSRVDTDKESNDFPKCENNGEERPSSPSAVQSAENFPPTDKEINANSSSPKSVDVEPANTSTSPNEALPDEFNTNKSELTKKKEKSTREVAVPADDVSKKSPERMSDSEEKLNTLAKEQLPVVTSDEKKTASNKDAVERESDTNSDSEAKTLKQSVKKGDGVGKNNSGSSKQSNAKRKQGSGKSVVGKSMKKVSGSSDRKEKVLSLKHSAKTTEDEKIIDKTTKTPSKRKQTPGKEKVSDENLVGSKIKVYWPDDDKFYEGVIDSFDPEEKKHKVLYTDGDEEILDLKDERWLFIDGDVESEREQTADQVGSDSSTDIPHRKKAKINANESAKRGKMDVSPKKVGIASSSKSKSATKTGGSSASKVEAKSKGSLSKSGKPANVSGSKSKDHTPKTGGKTVDVTRKAASKSKNEDLDSPKTGKSKADETSTTPTPSAKSNKKDSLKTTGKSKQETPKTPAISKGKSPKTGGDKSNNTDSTKVKFTSSKSKEGTDAKSSAASSKTMQNSKGGKSVNLSNDKGGDSKSGKKRRRDVKG